MSCTLLVRLAVLVLLVCVIAPASVFSQSDVARRTVAVTYPLDESVEVKFRGTTLLAPAEGRSKGEARRSSRHARRTGH